MDASGNYVVAWQDDRSGNNDIWAKVYNADGTVKVSEFQVHSTQSSDQNLANVGMADNGNFAVTWSDDVPATLKLTCDCLIRRERQSLLKRRSVLRGQAPGLSRTGFRRRRFVRRYFCQQCGDESISSDTMPAESRRRVNIKANTRTAERASVST